MDNLIKNEKFTRVLNAVAAGTSLQTGSVIDMQSWDAVTFVVAFGTITSGAATSIKVQQGAAADGSDMADLAGTLLSIADTDDNKLALIEVYRPQKRYVRVAVVRGTQNAVIDGAFAIQRGCRIKPVTHDTTTVVTPELPFNSPAEGTA